MAASVWSEHQTKDGRVYYYNRSTKQSSWEKPADFDGESAASASSSSAAAAASSSSSTGGGDAKKAAGGVEWEELWDPKNERPYYYNRATRKTQWLRPENVEIKPYAGAAAAASSASSASSTAAATEKTAAYAAKKDKHAKKAGDKAGSSSTGGKGHDHEADVEKHGAAEASATAHTAKKHHESSHKHHSDKKPVGNEDSRKSQDPAEEETAEQHDDEQNGDGDKPSQAEAATEDSAMTGKTETHHKKKKKKSKRERALELEAHRKKRRRDSEKRMIICDDEATAVPTAGRNSSQYESDTEDGKEASRLLLELSRTDAIMEANVLSVINGFLRAHQDADGPEVLVEKLSSSYRGHAQMIGLVASWLDALPLSKPPAESKVTFDVSEGAVIENKGATWEPSEEILYRHLKDIITDNYDPELVSNVLSGSASEPEWLTHMLNDRKWRMMLIELAETHKSCTLLQYAIRRISEAGHHKEIASITSASAFFSVFNGVLIDAFCRIPFSSEEEAREDVSALNKICCQSAHSYLYAVELLCAIDDKLYALERDATEGSTRHVHLRMVRAKLNRVRSELQDTAVEKYGAKAEPLHPLRRRHLGGIEARVAFSEAILTIIKTKKCSEAVAETLAKAYQQESGHESVLSPPPVAHLRDPIVLRSVLDRLFRPSDPMSPAFVQNCVFLLAYASSTKDERSILQTNAAGEIQIDADAMESTKKALAEASAICKSDNTLGYNMNQSGVVDKLISVMAVPAVSMGVLHWLEVVLTSSSFVNSTLLHICFPSLLRVLKASIKLHVAQWPIAFGVLVTSLRLHPEINPVKALELKRESLRSMVFLITSGYVLPVLEFVFANTLELDQALLRNFVAVLFARIAGPFSPKFVAALGRILAHPKVQTAITSCPPDTKQKLRAFAVFAKRNPGELSTDQLHALAGMQEL